MGRSIAQAMNLSWVGSLETEFELKVFVCELYLGQKTCEETGGVH